MAVERKLMTADELLMLRDDGNRHELIQGELRTMPPAGGPHGAQGDTATEVREKVDDWLRFRVRAVWVLYSGPRLDVFGAGGAVRAYGPDDEVDGGEVFPGIRMRLMELVSRRRG